MIIARGVDEEMAKPIGGEGGRWWQEGDVNGY